MIKRFDQDGDRPGRFRPFASASGESRHMRVATLVRLRWLSIAGQAAACAFVAWGLWFPFPVASCFALIALAVMLNLYLRARFQPSQRLSMRQSAVLLAFDILQPSGLMFLTGGIQNPFAMFLIVPAMIAAATQPAATTVGLGILAVVMASLLAFFHMPMPWTDGTLISLPTLYLSGFWFALVNVLVFATFYIYRVAAEARTLADALGATELVLQREQHLSALDGLAAAAAHELGTPLATIALVAKEMGRTAPADDPAREDIDLLIAQSERCRTILRQLTSLSSDFEDVLAEIPLSSLVEEVVAPHRDFGVAIRVSSSERTRPEPQVPRNAGVLYGLGNIVENAVDFARSEVLIELSWTEEKIAIRVLDDGEGFRPDILARIGDPFMASRTGQSRDSGGGLGLGLFIAKTLLERSGGRITFANRTNDIRTGAIVTITWPRSALMRAESRAGGMVEMGTTDMVLPGAPAPTYRPDR